MVTHMKNTKKLAIIGIFVLIVIVAISVTISVMPKEQPVIKIGYQALTVNLPLFTAYEKGYFGNVKIELVKFETTNQLIDAMLTNKIDATGIVALQPLLAVEAQSKDQFEIFAVNQQTPEKNIDKLVVKADSTIKTIADLKGKKLGIYPGSSQRAIAEIIVSKFMSASDVEIIELPPATQLGALQSGQVDALLTLEPLGTLAEANGVGNIIENAPMSKYVLSDFTLGAAAVSEKFLKEKPGVAKKIISGFDKGINNMEKNRAVLTKYTSVTEPIAQKIGIGNIVMVNKANINAIQQLADIYFAKAQLTAKVDVKDILLK